MVSRGEEAPAQVSTRQMILGAATVIRTVVGTSVQQCGKAIQEVRLRQTCRMA